MHVCDQKKNHKKNPQKKQCKQDISNYYEQIKRLLNYLIKFFQ